MLDYFALKTLNGEWACEEVLEDHEDKSSRDYKFL
jgi:hypothetical protein